MLGFDLALALPFTLFAFFPGWLKTLPKSGGWMEAVKKSLAFAELALAIKFLSNADLVEHLGLLPREVFIGSWIVIALGLSFYLSGLSRLFKKREEAEPVKMTLGRRIAALWVLLFAVYMLPGITNSRKARLSLLSGFLPPLNYSLYKNHPHETGVEPVVINDYQKALQLARVQHKPLLVDFTGWACVNCRKMEENVWSDPGVRRLIKDRFILVSLYVDDRGKLPASEQGMTGATGSGKTLLTIGDKWAAFEQENFQLVTQPLYVLLSPK